MVQPLNATLTNWRHVTGKPVPTPWYYLAAVPGIATSMLEVTLLSIEISKDYASRQNNKFVVAARSGMTFLLIEWLLEITAIESAEVFFLMSFTRIHRIGKRTHNEFPIVNMCYYRQLFWAVRPGVSWWFWLHPTFRRNYFINPSIIHTPPRCSFSHLVSVKKANKGPSKISFTFEVGMYWHGSVPSTTMAHLL